MRWISPVSALVVAGRLSTSFFTAVTPIPYSVPGLSPATHIGKYEESDYMFLNSGCFPRTSQRSFGGVSWLTWEQFFAVTISRNGAVFQQIAANVSLAVGPLDSDALLCLGHNLQVCGSIEGCGRKGTFPISKATHHPKYQCGLLVLGNSCFESNVCLKRTGDKRGADGVTGGVCPPGDERHLVLGVWSQAVDAVLFVGGEYLHTVCVRGVGDQPVKHGDPVHRCHRLRPADQSRGVRHILHLHLLGGVDL